MANLNIASSARLIGSLRLGNHVYIAQGSILRSVDDSINVGNDSFVLENSVLIGTPEHPLKVGRKTVFGHKCLAIGTEIGDLCEIGNGTIFLPGSRIGKLCIFGEGTLIPEDAVVPAESVVVGRPGQIIRKLTDRDREMIARIRGDNLALSPHEEKRIQVEPKEGEIMGNLYGFGTKHPVVAASAFIFDSAEITGDVIIGENAVIASGVKIIGDSHGPVRIGSNVQILENTVLHLLPDNQLIIGDHVTIGPGCIIHGTTIGPHSIIESGSIICDYSSLGKNTLVKSGSLVKQRSEFGDNQVLEGFPAKGVGENTRTLLRPAWAFPSSNQESPS